MITNTKQLLRLLFTISIALFSQSHIKSQEYIALAKPTTSRYFGYINENGKYIISPRFYKAYSFSKCGIAPIYDAPNDELLFINTKGDTVLQNNNQYNFINPSLNYFGIRPISEGTIIVTKDSKYGLIDIKGNIIVDIKYDTIQPILNGVTIAKLHGLHYIIEKNGEANAIAIDSLKEVDPFNCGLAKFELESGKCGYINKKGNITIEAKFTESTYFANNISTAANDAGRWGVIDTTGQWIIEPHHTYIWPFKDCADWTTARDFYGQHVILWLDGTRIPVDQSILISIPTNNLLTVSKNPKNKSKKERKEDRKESKKNQVYNYDDYGYLDKHGKWAITPSYSYVRPFHEGYATVAKGRLWGMIDEYGIWKIQPRFEILGDMIKLDITPTPNTTNKEISIDYYDIVQFITIIENLDTNDIQIKEENWSRFLSQDIRLVKWLSDFKTATNNFGMQSKIEGCLTVKDLNHSKPFSDSEIALRLLNAYLFGTQQLDKTPTITYDKIEVFLNSTILFEANDIRNAWNSESNIIDI